MGQVDFLKMGPMTFTEFLLADNADNLVEYLQSVNTPEAVPDVFFAQLEAPPQYWAEAPHEVDFIIQRGMDIIPLEVKADESIRATSIKRYAKNYPTETPVMVRLSLCNLSYDGNILNVPLFMVDELDRLLGIVIGK